MRFIAVFLVGLGIWAQTGSNALTQAVAKGEAQAVRRALAAGAAVNAASATGKTALIEAAEHGRAEIARLLIEAGADLNLSDRGVGTALEVAERAGHLKMVTLLRAAGARTSGKSVGDTVCVRPWKGEGYCGVVASVAAGLTEFRLRVTEVMGCKDGCAGRVDCSGGKAPRVGDEVAVPGSCLTHTGVKP